MVEDGLAVGCTQVLDDGFTAWLRERGIRLPTPATGGDGLSCNLLALARAVVSARHGARLNAALRARDRGARPTCA
jgi:N-dimethylarginine dimethylaminohydrolase